MKNLMLASVAALTLAAAPVFAAGAAVPAQQSTNATQSESQVQHAGVATADASATIVYSGVANELYPAPQGG